VEWPGNAGDMLPDKRLDITLQEENGSRRITVVARGEQYSEIIEDLDQ
jgi:tRNA A37 threonylcarbamoyladenosine biosynthesis protein TsaE